MIAASKGAVLEAYAAIVRDIGRAPTTDELSSRGTDHGTIRRTFGGMRAVEDVCREFYPELWRDAPLESVIAKAPPGKAKRYVVTTAVVGCDVDDAFLASLRSYCRERRAELIVMVAADPASRKSPGGYGYISKKLAGCHILGEDVQLNDALRLSTAMMSAKQINPETGLQRITKGCAVYASPKQRMQSIPHSGTTPRLFLTTGAITVPGYETDLYMSKRTAHIAEHDHVMGALVFEIESEQIFHVRQIRASDNGSFTDVARKYTGERSNRNVRAGGLVLGDYHAAQITEESKAAIASIVDATKPEAIVLHDLFDGQSINPFEQGRTITRGRMAARGGLSLEDELRKTRDELAWVAGMTERVFVVRSNHDAFLDRYLEDARFKDEPWNSAIALRLALALHEGRNALEAGIEMCGGSPGNVVWLRRDESHQIAGIEIGHHGHRGPNGAKGTPKNLEATLGDAVIGHSHSPGILRGIFSVGTSTDLRLSYNEGPSSWCQTHCLIHKDGGRQLVTVIGGAWRA